MFSDKSNYSFIGKLNVKDKDGNTIAKSGNMVLSSSKQILILGLAKEIQNTYIRMASWDYDESTDTSLLPSFYTMEEMQVDTLVEELSIDSITYITEVTDTEIITPYSITFKTDLISAEDGTVIASGIVGENLREFGLYFGDGTNEILYARVALDCDFYFCDYMEFYLEWTIEIDDPDTGETI